MATNLSSVPLWNRLRRLCYLWVQETQPEVYSYFKRQLGLVNPSDEALYKIIERAKNEAGIPSLSDADLLKIADLVKRE